jgi:HJR/Mrr/RecB family endonuclease
MCNNAIKKFPKNYDSMASKAFVEIDETYQEQQEEVAAEANSVEFIEADEVVENDPSNTTDGK